MSSSIKVLLGVLGGALLMLALVVIFVNGGFLSPSSMMGQGGMMDGAWGLLWMLVPLLFWGGLLALIVWAVIRLTSNPRHAGGLGIRGESGEEILKQRFARGEIDTEEFEERRRILAREPNDH